MRRSVNNANFLTPGWNFESQEARKLGQMNDLSGDLIFHPFYPSMNPPFPHECVVAWRTT